MSNRLYDHYLNEFDNQLSAKKSTFGDKYSAGKNILFPLPHLPSAANTFKQF